MITFLAQKILLKPQLILLGIIILGFCLRFYHLTSVPISPYWEEVALGYDAYSILKTGKDFHGQTLPLVAFTSFGDYKPSLYFYTLVPFIQVLGLQLIAIRLPSVLSGTLCLFIVYHIALNLKFHKSTALLASFLLAISPWAIHFSRVGFEVNLGTMLLCAGVLFGLKGRTQNWYLIISALLLGLSMYAYHGLRLVSPLLGISLVVIYWSTYKMSFKIISLLLAILICLPILLSLTNPLVNQRFAETNIWSQSKAVEITNTLRQSNNNTLISRLIYHRYWFWIKEILASYLKNFNPAFLFLTGDGNARHNLTQFGLLYLYEIVTIPLGIFIVVKNRKNWLLLAWLVIAPIPVALSLPSPHTLRLLPLAPLFALLSALGINRLKKNRKLLIILMVGILVSQFSYWFHQYFQHYKISSSASWQYGYRETVDFVESNKAKYDQIYFTRAFGRPSMYIMFYGQYDPSYIQLIEPSSLKDQGELLSLDKYIFTNQIPNPKPNTLVVDKKVRDTGLLVFSFPLPNTDAGFYVYEY